MARKIRDFVYGSPKFEREINNAVSDTGGDKIYQHHITILAKDGSDESYYYEYTVYNNTPDELIATRNPTYMDVINLLVDTITNEEGLTPDYFNEGHWNYFIATRGEENSLKAYYYDIQTQGYSEESSITSVLVAYDAVREM